MPQLSSVLIRKLVLLSMCLNVRVYATYISSKNNKQSDLLSRLKVEEFKRITPEADSEMTEISEKNLANLQDLDR